MVWIGEWRLDPVTRSVSRGDEEHRLEPKMAEVLLLLSERPGQPVRREELERGVWSGAAVGTDLLNRTIWKLRKVLGDEPSAPDYIETIPRVGYRLIAPVRETEPAPSVAPGRKVPAWAVGVGVVAAVALVVTVIRSEAGGDPEFRIVPLTTSPGYEAAPSLSPDGRLVAYQRYDPAAPRPTWDVAVIDLATGDARTIAGGSDVDETGPSWNAGGDSLAFIRRGPRTCAIVAASLSGGDTELASCAPDQGHEIAWEPHGSIVVASSGPGQTVGLVRLHPASGEREVVTRPPVGYDGDGRPRPSPDGTRLAFVRQRTDGVSDVYVVESSGGRSPRRVTFDDRRVSGLAWEPDGSALVFSSNRGGNSQLWRVATSGRVPRPVPITGRNASRLALGDGLLVYEEYFGDSDVWVFDPVTGRHEPWSGSGRSEWAPTLSPDGSRVAFLSDRSGSAEVWTVPSTGGRPQRLTWLDGAPVDPPRWSPDGSRLVFAAALHEGGFDLFTVDGGGASPVRMTDDPGDERVPAWWGERVVYSANRTGSSELWIMGPEGGSDERLTSGGGWAARPSADGKTLFYTRPDEAGLWAIDEEGAPRLVWPDVHPSDWANWTPTPEGLLYFRVRGAGARAIERWDPGAPTSDTLTTVESEVPDRAGISVAADGRVLYSRVVRSESDLWIARQGAGGSPPGA